MNVEYMTLMMELKQQRREGAEQKQVEISSLCTIRVGCFSLTTGNKNG